MQLVDNNAISVQMGYDVMQQAIAKFPELV